MRFNDAGKLIADDEDFRIEPNTLDIKELTFPGYGPNAREERIVFRVLTENGQLFMLHVSAKADDGTIRASAHLLMSKAQEAPAGELEPAAREVINV